MINLLLNLFKRKVSPEWDSSFMQMAVTWSARSKDPSSKVGAVISNGKEFISAGFNGFATSISDLPERLNNREVKYALTLHAEVNAILFAKRDLAGYTIYTTHPPCERCAAIICQSGIKRVVCLAPTPEFAQRWDEVWTKVQFKEAKVSYETMPR